MELFSEYLGYILSWQISLNQEIALLFRQMGSDEATLLKWFSILGIGFIYGVLHALGPGHGKGIVSLYFLSYGKNYRKSIKMGFSIALVHAISAFSVSLLTFFTLRTFFSSYAKSLPSLTFKVAGVLIIIIGAYLLFNAFRNKQCNHHNEEVNMNHKKSDFFVALSAGIVPCPGLITIILFAIYTGHLFLGFLTTITLSLGIGFTSCLIGILSTTLRKGIIHKPNFHKYLAMATSTFIMLLGSSMLLYDPFAFASSF